MNWKILHKGKVETVDDLIQVLLENRQIKDKKQFLQPLPPDDLKPSKTGFDVKQLQSAAKRLKQAIKNQEKVVIYGDYDADGIVASSIVWLTLNHLGLTAVPFIPDREEHGYGLSVKGLKQIQKKHQPDLIITVDNGITAGEALAWAQENDLEVIVTDHHQPEKELPPADIIVHSTEISGAAVAWFLMKELAPDFVLSLVDLAAIATITDMLPLTGANRSFVKFGLRMLRNSDRAGLKALYEAAKIDPNRVSTYTIGFLIGPRINAAGRIADGIEAMRLLCTSNLSAARKIARKLDKINLTRQDLTQEHLRLALVQSDEFQDKKMIMIASEEFHEGVIGLLAGKLTEKYYKPAIVMAQTDNLIKASARSVPGLNITNLLREASDLLINVGGHEQAAGFSAEAANLIKLQNKLEALADDMITEEMLQPEMEIDLLIEPELMTMETVRALYSLAPYGIGNRAPVFGFKQIKLISAMTMGRDNNHLRLSLQINPENFQNLTAVGWNLGHLVSELKNEKKIDAAFNLEINRWKGKENLQLKIKDIQS